MKATIILILGLFVTWLSSIFSLFWITLIPMFITALFLIRKKPAFIALLLLFSPFVVLPINNMLKATVNYVQGDPKFRSVGYPAFAHEHEHLVSTQYRIGYKSSCMIGDFIAISNASYNQTVKLLISTFGYPKNAYLGTIPTQEEAIAIINQYFNSGDYSFLFDSNKIPVDETCKLTLNPKEENTIIRVIDLEKNVPVYRYILYKDDHEKIKQLYYSKINEQLGLFK